VTAICSSEKRDMEMKKVMLVFGTRPEAIKMCPLVLELQKSQTIQPLVCVTGQHREMLQQVLDVFHVVPNDNLNVMKDRQTITGITSSILQKLEEVLQREKPDMVLVHGDTTTSMAAALAAFYARIPVGHVEAGLRTYNKYSPFPEEMNRLITSRVADYHFAPTSNNQQALAREGVTENVYVTGNTVIDAFRTTIQPGYVFASDDLKHLNDQDKRIILVTAHRRENLGEPLKNICRALVRICQSCPDVQVIYPMHMNPLVHEIAEPILRRCKNIEMIAPLDVSDMHNLMARCFMVMTDSGGLQEEVPHLGKPVLVLRTETERPEAVAAGTVKLTGIVEEDIVRDAMTLLTNEDAYRAMSRAVNPYGDGHASERIRKILEENL